MTFRLLRLWLAAAALLVAWNIDLGTSNELQAARRTNGDDLFYNYYVPPGGCSGVGAQLYPCPRPVPPWVGHTYVTYQPLMPHEFLYKHHRVYRRCNPDAGWTRTMVIWR